MSGPLPDGYLDLYKLAVEMADRVSARRAVASSFFLTALSTLVVLAGAISTSAGVFAAPGIVLAAAWWLLLRSYRRLNRAKFDVIQDMEDLLPVAIFKNEWKALKGGADEKLGWRDRYAELGFVEQVVPVVFAVVFAIVWIGD